MRHPATKLRHVLALGIALGAAAIATPSFAYEELPKLDLAQYQGKVVYLDFWASWCTPCRQSFPWLVQLQKELGPQGFVVVTVNVNAADERELADQFLKEVPIPFGVVFDPKGQLAKDWQLLGMPSSYLIDRNGKVRSSHVSFHKAEGPQREAEIKALLAEPVVK